MADGTTTRYGYVKPEVGASADTWGAKLNNNLDDADAVGGAITTTGSANAYVLTTGLSLSAYVAGQSFDIKASFGNTGAATINVDTLGAKSLTKDGTTALASGDIVSGNIYRISYDGTQFQIIAGLLKQAQDATLTALAALSWSSGSPVVQFTAADTVSLTLTPSVSSITASNAGLPATLTNTTDAAANQGLIVQSDRATPTTDDTVYISMRLSDSAGNQDEFVRITAQGQSVASGSETAQMRLSIIESGVLTAKMALGTSFFSALANNVIALGTTALGFSALHLAEGAAINWDNGDAVLTQTGNVLELTGAGMAAPLVQVTGVGGVTLDAATHRNRQLLLTGNITLDDGVFAAGDWHVFTCDGTNRTITRAAGLTMRINGTDSATGTLAANQTASAVWVTASEVHLIGSGIS